MLPESAISALIVNTTADVRPEAFSLDASVKKKKSPRRPECKVVLTAEWGFDAQRSRRPRLIFEAVTTELFDDWAAIQRERVSDVHRDEKAITFYVWKGEAFHSL